MIAVVESLVSALGCGAETPRRRTTSRCFGNVDIRQVSLAFQDSERIVEMRVEEGAKVTAGQVLAVLATLHARASGGSDRGSNRGKQEGFCCAYATVRARKK